MQARAPRPHPSRAASRPPQNEGNSFTRTSLSTASPGDRAAAHTMADATAVVRYLRGGSGPANFVAGRR
jgi:hypothetical protein